MQDGKILMGSLFGYKKSDVNAYLLELSNKAKEKINAERKKAEMLQKENAKLEEALHAKDEEIEKLMEENRALKELLDGKDKQQEESPLQEEAAKPEQALPQEETVKKTGALSARFKKQKQEE